MSDAERPDIPALAARLHDGHLDKAGAPYVTHLARVAAILKRRWPQASADEVAAILDHYFAYRQSWENRSRQISII